jgi:DNA-binding SARP family transcriptional activator
MFVLELFGTLSLRSDARPVPVPAQQRRPLGLLAVVAMSGRNGASRDRIETYLWPESGSTAARHSLDQTVYAIRQALGSDAILSSGRELRLNADAVRVDVWAFEDAHRSRQWMDAAEWYKGPLLDGVHLADSRELESWVDAERARLSRLYREAVECLAAAAAESGDHAQSVAWCHRLANADPLSGHATKRLMLALVAAGDRAGAVSHARVYQQLVRQQLEMEPDADIEELAASLRRPRPVSRSASPPADPAIRNVPPRDSAAPSTTGPARRPRALGIGVLAGLAALLVGAATMGSRQLRGPEPSVGTGPLPRGAAATRTGARPAYRHAVEAWSDGSQAGLDTAVAYFRRAIEADPTYAEAYAGLADAYVMLGYFGYRPGDAMFPRAREAAEQSVRLDSTLAAPRPALAYALTWAREFVRADSEFRKALALAPPRAAANAPAADPIVAAGRQWYPVLLMLLAQKPEPARVTLLAATRDRFALRVPVIELTFTKWIDDYPAMTGFTSDGPGTMRGAILSRIDDGTITHLVARYELDDPSGAHALKTVVQGTADDSVGTYALNGLVAWGWMTGAHVHATFRRTTPCAFGKRDVCFSGTIQLQPR